MVKKHLTHEIHQRKFGRVKGICVTYMNVPIEIIKE